MLVLNGPYNLLSFRMPNVIFSLVVGLVMLVLGAYGRFSGRLPSDNPYAAEVDTIRDGKERRAAWHELVDRGGAPARRYGHEAGTSGYPRSMTTPDDAVTAGTEDTGPVPTEQSDTPVDESPDGDGVHLSEQPVDTS